MREIKFRAWGESEDTEYEPAMQHSFDVAPDGNIFYRGDVQTKWILMQYTGLHDKNGKEIYEGDIVQNINTKDKETITYDEGCFWWGAAPINIIKRIGLETSSNMEVHKVIGNIYENPQAVK
jgi:uncharacterized phage protein (TIGR01671 family)